MVDTARRRTTQTRGLWRTVEAACGPATGLAALGYQFPDWVTDGPAVAPATRDLVEPCLAGYLDAAVRAGRRWGRLTGLSIGLVASLLMAVVAVVWTVWR